MVINENNSYTNSFSKGMNSDTTYDQLPNSNYVFGKNIRITKNYLIGSSNEETSSQREGIVTPVYEGITLSASQELYRFKTLLAVDSVDNIGVIVYKTTDDRIVVNRFILDPETETTFDSIYNSQIWWESKEGDAKDIKSASTVLYRELDNVIKLYIATGVYPIITLRVDDINGAYGEQSINYVINNRIFPTNRVYINAIIGGKLKTSQVQYTYRLYNKHGITTQLAPLTNKIQVIDSNRNKEQGNAEDTETSIGFNIKIKIPQDLQRYGRIQIYRLSYIRPNEDAEVALIYDDSIKTSDGYFQFNDVGLDPLQSLTMEEFASLSGLLIIPKVIENNQDYMFAANVYDDTIIKDLELRSTPKIEQITAEVCISEDTKKSMNAIPRISGQNYTGEITTYLKQRDVNVDLVKDTYSNIFTSSLLRSLRRGEKYRYGIIFYDKYGRRSDVIKLGDIQVDDSKTNCPFKLSSSANGYKLYANPIGVKITIPTINKEDIVGCQIVRRSSKDIYQNTLLQVALARPLNQTLYTQNISDTSKVNQLIENNSPYYPFGFLTSDHTEIIPSYYNATVDEITRTSSTENKELFQILSSEIDYRRDDVLSKLSQDSITLTPLYPVFPVSESNTTEQMLINLNDNIKRQINHPKGYQALLFALKSGNTVPGSTDNPITMPKVSDMQLVGVVTDIRLTDSKYLLQDVSNKSSDNLVFNYFTKSDNNTYSDYTIRNIKDVKIPKWYEGFSNIQFNGDQIVGGVKQYKSYTTTIGKFKYNNWVSSGLYDLQIYMENQPNIFKSNDGSQQTAQFLYGEDQRSRDDTYSTDAEELRPHVLKGRGYIGPGPSCFLIELDDVATDLLSKKVFGSYICNIRHNISYQDVESDEQVQYYGFGNFFKLKHVGDGKYQVDGSYETESTLNTPYLTVFDGDIYITPHELTTSYKSYDFNSKDSLQSMQVVNYVPLESKVNTFFDYGMNYLNTQSPNILYEPGSIEGITAQERACHQYNMIYSNNDVSNDIFNVVITDKNDTNSFPYRTYFSEPKVNGEYIDNFNVFKPASFIDVDNKYGEITEMMTDKNILYYWQNTAFGKFSVNERSLINDQNGNTIMLGQAGILSRYDYISTKYGMRPYDYCAVATENGVYWVDINNRAVVVANTQQAINYSERANVQNILNNDISTDIPRVDYDIQNNEILCKCLKNGEQLIFNTKYNIATSVYNRKYDDILYIYNHLYGVNCGGDSARFTKYNYLTANDRQYMKYLAPMQLDFVVNPSASVDKVFDSQTLIPMKRTKYDGDDENPIESKYLKTVSTIFETDIIDNNNNTIEGHTDREGNILYNVPRFGSEEYGNRMRGKWLRTFINKEQPDGFFTVSHAITKIRQSFS